MGKLKNKKRKNISTQKDPFREKGITLIALVVTIIVLLILAGISIAMLTGNDGIIQKAIEAKDATRAGAVQEKINMIIAENLISEYSDGERRTREEVIQELQEEENLTLEEVSELEDKNIIQIGNMNVDFSGLMTLTQMYNKAIAEGCTNENGTCTDETHLHAGDYVNYKAPTTGSHSVPASKSGVDYEQIYNVADNSLNWRVLGIETDKDTGEKSIKLIADSPAKQSEETGNGNPYFDIKGAEGYLYAPDEMDAIGALFKNDEYAKEARSVNMYDINQALGITTDDQIKEKNFFVMQGAIQYGENYGPFEGQWTPEDWLKSGQPTSTVSGPVTGYGYMIGNESLPPEYSAMTVNVENTRLRSMLFDNVEAQTGKAYWLASRGVYAYLGDDYAHFGPGIVYAGGGVTVAGIGGNTFGSDGDEYVVSGGAAVRPLVVLKSDITKSEISIKEDQPDSWQS